jgi:ABC-type lipoprotein release transport system permease subunit
MKITKEIKKFKIDVIKAINLMFPNDTPRSLLIKIASTPSIGVKSKDDNNIYIYINKLKKYLYFVWNGNVPDQLLNYTI